MQFIPGDIVEEAMIREAISHIREPLIMGVDVARFGDEQSLICWRRGRDARSYPPVKVRNIDTMQLASLVMTHAMGSPETNGEVADAIFIDEGGVGGGVVDRCHQLGLPVIGVNFGSKPSGSIMSDADGERYANRRAEMWGTMRAWLRKGGAIQDDPDLAADLTGVEYGFNANNQIQLEKKEDMKKRGLASPDDGDALALTFADHVHKRDDREFVSRGEPEVYNPYA
jgi:phage terminase large subunit